MYVKGHQETLSNNNTELITLILQKLKDNTSEISIKCALKIIYF